MSAYIYVLWSERAGKRYIGACHDLQERLRSHNAGKQRFTRGGTPWTLIYSEECPDFHAARKRENYLKTGRGRAWLDKNVEIPERWQSPVYRARLEIV